MTLNQVQSDGSDEAPQYNYAVHKLIQLQADLVV